jgi:uncharacterized protein (TIRG00374 family)
VTEHDSTRSSWPVKRLLWPIIGIAAGAAFLYMALASVSIRELSRLLEQGDWRLPGIAILACVGVFLTAKAGRWQVLLGATRIPVTKLMRPVAAGLLLNALIPHSGEFARAFYVNRDFGRPTSSVLVSIAVERVLDFLTVLSFAALAGAFTPVPQAFAPAVRALSIVSAILSLVILVALVAPEKVTSLIVRCISGLPSRARQFVTRQVHHGLDGLVPLRAAHRVGAAFVLSVVQWAAVVFCVVACCAVVGFHLPVAQAALVMIALVLVFAIPNAPAYLGATQVAFLGSLVPFGVGREPAIAASLVYTAGMVGLTMLAGAVALATQPTRHGRLP